VYVTIDDVQYTALRALSFNPSADLVGARVPINEFQADLYTDDDVGIGGYAELYDDACLKAGEALYQAGRPYEASAYFRKVKDVRRTQRWFSNACYRIIGKWADKSGKVIAEFREDSTCTIAGENFTFLVQDSYTLKTEQDGSMEVTFRISHLTEDRLSLRDMREGREAGYELYRAEAAGE
jgi:hypothetical protein